MPAPLPQGILEGPGGAPVLVLANSLASTTAMWVPQMAAWRQRFRVFRYDYAGHGDPGFDGSAPDSMEGLGQALLAALDAHGVDRFAFAGISLGGMLGLYLAATAPERVTRLVAANCRYFPSDPARQQWNDRIAAVRAGGMEAIAGPTLERWLTDDFRARHPEQAAAVRAMVCSTSREGYAHAASAVRDFDARPLLERITCPTLVVSGAQDLGVPSEQLAVLADTLGARHLVLDPCAHLSSIERAATVTEEFGAFLA